MKSIGIIGSFLLLGLAIYAAISLLCGNLGDTVLRDMEAGVSPIRVNVSPLGPMINGDGNYNANTSAKRETIQKNAKANGYIIEKREDVWILRKPIQSMN